VAKPTRIIGHHRNFELAKRHLRQLGPDWVLKERRNAKGRFSHRGHTFIFEKVKPPPPPGKVFEWIVSVFPSPTASPKNFSIVVTARDETEAVQVAKDFLASHRNTRHIAISTVAQLVPHRGNLTNEASGEAEFRSKS
jgi:hypothetical protein